MLAPDLFQSTFLRGPIGAYVLTPTAEAVVMAVNDRFLQWTGRKREEMVGRSLFEVFPDDPADPGARNASSLRDSILETIESGEVQQLPVTRYPIPRTDPQGRRYFEERFWDPVNTPILDAEGKVVCILHTTNDVTDRVRAEQALTQASRRKDEFLAMLAHELRNPLAPISAAADLLAMGLDDPDRVRQTSSIITRQVRHMTGLIDDLLDVSRVTRGLIQLDARSLDLKRVVADALEQTRPVVEARGHRMTVQLPAGAAIVRGDHKRLVQVVANLLTNAARYTPEGGEITLEMAVEDRQVQVSVSDTGIGMGPDLVEHAFDLFSQAERPADRSQGGLGIGLALVRSLMALHDGSVSAASDGPGRGSRFTLSLPRLDAEPEAAAADIPAAREATRRAPLKVLVVDDNRDAAAMLAMLVETLGHEALVEHASDRALERARIEEPQVCLLDVGLPGMDGHELARRLRAAPGTAGATLVAVTGYAQERDRAGALRAGFDHYFVKPVDASRIASLLEELGSARDAADGQPQGSRSTMLASRSGPVDTIASGQPASSSSARR